MATCDAVTVGVTDGVREGVGVGDPVAEVDALAEPDDVDVCVCEGEADPVTDEVCDAELCPLVTTTNASSSAPRQKHDRALFSRTTTIISNKSFEKPQR